MTPEEMEKLPKKLEKIFSNLELDVMADIVERLKETKDITPTIDWLLLRMTAIGKSKSAIKRAIQKALDLAEKEIDAIYQKAAESLFARDAGIYKAAGKDFVTLKENDEVLQLIDAIKRQTAEEMTNITRSTGFMTRNEKGEKVMTSAAEFFQQKLDQAILEIDTGTYDYNTSIQKVIDEMTTSGLRTVEYASGRMARVEVAARRAVMTGNSQLTDKINEKNAELLETEYWEVAWHMGARNTGTGYRNHQSWQGKVYSNEEMKTICGLGEMLGFGGINCYHIRYPFVPGVSKRNYTDEWLEEQNKKENTKKPYKGKEYDTYAALQHQRKLERTMRKQNQDIQLLDRADAAEDTLMAAKSRRRATEREYVDFSKKMGLRQQRERLAVPKSVPKSAEKVVAKPANSGIIETADTKGVIQVHTVGKIDKDIYKCVTEDIVTDEVIITDRQIQHIKDRHPNDYEKYEKYFSEIVSKPDYIIEAAKPKTALVLKEIIAEDQEVFKAVVRLATSEDDPNYKNSIITFMKIDDKEWERLLRNKKILYKRE